MKIAYYVVCALVLSFLVAPVFVVIPISFSASPYLEFPPSDFSLRWYREFFGLRSWYGAMLNSLHVAAVTMVVSAVLGTASALALADGRLRGSKYLQGILISPMIVPHIVVAVAVYAWFSQLQLIGTATGLVVIYVAFTLPFMSITVSSSLQQFDRTLEFAAMNLGASRFQLFWRVTFPCILPGVLAGAMFSFVMAFDELIVALFIAGTSNITLPKRMWDGLQTEINPTIAAASTIMIFTSFGLFFLAEIIRRMYRSNKGGNSGWVPGTPQKGAVVQQQRSSGGEAHG